jgi:hypothetical protein
MGFLYRLDFASGKSYIGITNGTMKRRLRSHRKKLQQKSDFALYRAWRKYGEPNVVTLVRADKDYLMEIEPKAIVAYGTRVPNGYNLTAGGFPAMLWHSQETRDKIGAAGKGRVCSAETRAKISAANLGHPVLPETRAKMSMVHMGKILSPEHCAKLSEAHMGQSRPCSPETRIKISESNVGRGFTSRQRAGLLAANLGRKWEPDAIATRKVAIAAGLARAKEMRNAMAMVMEGAR